MRYYNVVRPCVVGKLHYARPTTQPIQVDDVVAAPLVAEGSLEPYLPAAPAVADEPAADEFLAVQASEYATETIEPAADPEPPARKPRARRSANS